MSATTVPDLPAGVDAAPVRDRAGVRRLAWLLPVGLFLLAVLLYANTANFALMYSWDDNRYVTDNPLLRDPSINGVVRIFTEAYFAAYIPVTIFAYWVQWQFYQNWAPGYHIVNIVMNAANAVLLFYFVRRLLGKPWVAVLAAVLWIVHPLQVETVAWVSQHKNTFSMFFTLIAFLFHLRSTAPDRKRGDLMWAYAAYLAAALSKPAVVGVPVLFFLYDWWWAKLPLRRALTRNLIPLIIGAATALLIVVTHEEGGGIKPYRGDSIFVTGQLMLIVYWDYLVSIVWPFDLNNRYYYPPDLTQDAALSMWLGFGLILLTIWFVIKQPLGKPFSAFAAAWVWLFLLPVSNIVPINIERADRYMYFPLVIIFAGVALAVERLWHWGGDHMQARAAVGDVPDMQQIVRYGLSAGLGMLVLGWAVTTYNRSWVWENEGTLWRDHLIDYDFSHTGLLNLGVFHFNEGQYADAERTFLRMLEVYPGAWQANRFLGHTMLNTDRPAEAVQFYAAAVQNNPNEPSNRYFLAQALHQTRDFSAALEQYRLAFGADAGLPVAGLINMGEAALNTGEYQLAVDAYTTAESRFSASGTLAAQIASNLCAAQAELNQFDAALSNCQESVQIESGNGFYYGRLAHVLLRANRPADALTAAQNGVRVQPTLALNYRVAGDAYLTLGDLAQARTAYETALQLDPNNRRAQQGLQTIAGTGQATPLDASAGPVAGAEGVADPAPADGTTIAPAAGVGVGGE